VGSKSRIWICAQRKHASADCVMLSSACAQTAIERLKSDLWFPEIGGLD
jgi:hypothetical protein